MASSSLRTQTETFGSALWATTRGKFFGVTFTKRSDGQERRMVCRLGVRPKNPKLTEEQAAKRREQNLDNGLVTVWDTVARNYRSIPVDGVKQIRFRGLVL